ncbi:class E sortase [Streptomyces sp. NBC_01216]|uniref:class E sortase n=1 Tax=unclassified Streptomyces TaxID=2593676 RepID=UPI002E12E554|nr:class E sortase [Streptomyces sp. NBC_01216]
MSVRLIVRTFSELCVTLGTLIVLFVVHLLFWTGVEADGASAGQLRTLRNAWETRPRPDPSSTAAPAAPRPYAPGEGLAVMYVPRLGGDWEWPVLEGTATGTLKKGLGHYTGGARLGETGNFAVAGHRRTYGDPFRDFPRLRPGDAVVLTDGTTWYTYRVARAPYRTVPTDTGVIAPVPAPLRTDAAVFDGPGRYLTLTTCDPEWGSSHRLVVWAHLDATQPVTRGRPPSLGG